MARALLRFDSPEAVFWVQDYHFLTLGVELRRLDVDRPIGFFLHTPWAERRTMMAVPHLNDIVRDMLAYDLIGFQTVEDRQNFEDYLHHELGITVGRWHDRFAMGLDPARHLPDRHRRRRIRQARHQSGGAT